MYGNFRFDNEHAKQDSGRTGTFNGTCDPVKYEEIKRILEMKPKSCCLLSYFPIAKDSDTMQRLCKKYRSTTEDSKTVAICGSYAKFKTTTFKNSFDKILTPSVDQKTLIRLAQEAFFVREMFLSRRNVRYISGLLISNFDGCLEKWKCAIILVLIHIIISVEALNLKFCQQNVDRQFCKAFSEDGFAVAFKTFAITLDKSNGMNILYNMYAIWKHGLPETCVAQFGKSKFWEQRGFRYENVSVTWNKAYREANLNDNYICIHNMETERSNRINKHKQMSQENNLEGKIEKIKHQDYKTSMESNQLDSQNNKIIKTLFNTIFETSDWSLYFPVQDNIDIYRIGQLYSTKSCGSHTVEMFDIRVIFNKLVFENSIATVLCPFVTKDKFVKVAQEAIFIKEVLRGYNVYIVSRILCSLLAGEDTIGEVQQISLSDWQRLNVLAVMHIIIYAEAKNLIKLDKHKQYCDIFAKEGFGKKFRDLATTLNNKDFMKKLYYMRQQWDGGLPKQCLQEIDENYFWKDIGISGKESQSEQNDNASDKEINRSVPRNGNQTKLPIIHPIIIEEDIWVTSFLAERHQWLGKLLTPDEKHIAKSKPMEILDTKSVQSKLRCVVETFLESVNNILKGDCELFLGLAKQALLIQKEFGELGTRKIANVLVKLVEGAYAGCTFLLFKQTSAFIVAHIIMALETIRTDDVQVQPSFAKAFRQEGLTFSYESMLEIINEDEIKRKLGYLTLCWIDIDSGRLSSSNILVYRHNSKISEEENVKQLIDVVQHLYRKEIHEKRKENANVSAPKRRVLLPSPDSSDDESQTNYSGSTKEFEVPAKSNPELIPNDKNGGTVGITERGISLQSRSSAASSSTSNKGNNGLLLRSPGRNMNKTNQMHQGNDKKKIKIGSGEEEISNPVNRIETVNVQMPENDFTKNLTTSSTLPVFDIERDEHGNTIIKFKHFA